MSQGQIRGWWCIDRWWHFISVKTGLSFIVILLLLYNYVCMYMLSTYARPANWPAGRESGPHSSTKPAWPDCRLKTRVGADFINTQNNDTWVIESWRSLFRRGFFQWPKHRKIIDTLSGGQGARCPLPQKLTPISAFGLDFRPLEFQAVALALPTLPRPLRFAVRMTRLIIYQCWQVCLVLSQVSRLTDLRAFGTLQAKIACKNIHYVRTATRGGTRCGFILRSIRPLSISGSFLAMSGRVSNLSAENGSSQRKTYNGVTVPLRQQTD